ncbi:transposase IS66 [Lacticaseibacillus camelliae DSM 22697 = JCM 13995]|uniref:Transposase IS66 n=1 Tax=Lacticaseibacillus camelliae DSM 22697 = JCM 13995 TaxID=1423730 RepID=A0A0R2EUL6_9LACO|nr:transposase IS66 [Lacticaseibacillus camelliae DSM 22697 = JCM 13995]
MTLTYAINQRQLLNRVLDYGEIDLSNNASEGNMKAFVTGRKNWLFASRPKGTEANTIWMTIVETAKGSDLDPRRYIEDLLEWIPQLPTFVKPEQLEGYLPWNIETESSRTISA